MCNSSNVPHIEATKNKEKQVLANRVQSENILSKEEKDIYICLGVVFKFDFMF